MLARGEYAGDAGEDFQLVLQLARDGNTQQLSQFIERGHSLDLVDECGRSVVLAVTMHKDIAALELLIELGADVDAYDSSLSAEVIDQTAFLYAGAHGMPEAIKILLTAGAQPDIYNYYGGTALIPAAEKGHIETVRLLLEKSAIDINHINRLGWTALMEAVILSDGGERHQHIVALLLQHGADASILDKEGVSLLAHAKKRSYTAMCELLQKA